MKKIFAFLVLSLATSSSFAIPCTSSEISGALQHYIDAQPICFSPCEAAKVYKDVYSYGLFLINSNCSDRDPVAVNALKDLNQALADANAAIRAHCN